ncbi:hypothetical protein JG550_000847 [Curtobacterium flaccumfaciens pv. flaccumfaciens]|uniref:DUF6414 family protein n=1 Tax=Curtobacterium flaccumfaciens TaxID=2035 RepID=UPI001ADC464F|nr:hypothetical protein [Curtobacterium flaccumfaciens]MBO9046714.1 hypothetical protein [Curtobacterium flaccumfaciens pv. flaccumfaciens]QTR91588.1 hypothetical protein JG550_000847 [Curtobacterium flaccumfaciens pv. flaccumfaciens]
MADAPAPLFLAHPIYLDENMMLSFLAHLDGGVSLVEEQQDTTTASSTAAASLRAAIRAKLATFASAELSGQGDYKSESGDTQQVRRSKQHTAASLFNLLYEYLKADDAIVHAADLENHPELKAGQLVELEGAYRGNPLEDVLHLVNSILPYIAPEPAPVPAAKPAKARSGNPAAKNGQGATAPLDNSAEQTTAAMIRQMIADSNASPVHDLLVKTAAGLDAVVVVSSEYFSAAINEMLRSGTVKVLGKVTWVLSDTDAINLMRRTVIGAAGDTMSKGMLDDFRTVLPTTNIAEPIVKAPALQIIPMAIFV